MQLKLQFEQPFAIGFQPCFEFFLILDFDQIEGIVFVRIFLEDFFPWMGIRAIDPIQERWAISYYEGGSIEYGDLPYSRT